MQKNTISVGGSTALDTAYTLYIVNQTALHCFNSTCLYILLVKVIGSCWSGFQQNFVWVDWFHECFFFVLQKEFFYCMNVCWLFVVLQKEFCLFVWMLLVFLCITKKGAGSPNVIRQRALGTCTNCFPTTTTHWKKNLHVTYDCVTTCSLFPQWSFFPPSMCRQISY